MEDLLMTTTTRSGRTKELTEEVYIIWNYSI